MRTMKLLAKKKCGKQKNKNKTKKHKLKIYLWDARDKRETRKQSLSLWLRGKCSGNMWYWDLKRAKAKWAMNGECSGEK